jgi:hypothetical protein
MIDTQREKLRLLAKSSPDVPGNPHPSTLVRWALRGIRGLKLETVVIGGRRYTSIEAIHRFISTLSAQKTREVKILSSDAAIDQRLDEEGFGRD